MIYDRPAPTDPIDQADLIDGCPLLHVLSGGQGPASPPVIGFEFNRVIVLTQTCDLANEKASLATVAEVFDAQLLVDQKVLKGADIKGPVRAGRVWGWYFLPADAAISVAEMVIDLRRLHTVRLDLLRELCAAGNRKARVRMPYREHLAKHFADTFSRIGLPLPYETM
jgi:hypothetical protein